jgi:hypothetical protein
MYSPICTHPKSLPIAQAKATRRDFKAKKINEARECVRTEDLCKYLKVSAKPYTLIPPIPYTQQ